MDEKIWIIDDEGNLFDFIGDALEDDKNIDLIRSKSDPESLKEYFRTDYNLIMINKDNLENDVSHLIQYVKDHLYYLVTPIVVLSSDEKYVKDFGLFEEPVVSCMIKPVDLKAFKMNLETFLDIFVYNRDVNDISNLPNTDYINSKIAEWIDKKTPFSFLFLDLDHFKEYNEYFGLLKGNDVLLLLSDILMETISEYGSINDFIGHVDGDDFVLILEDYKTAEKIGNEVIRQFDERIKKYYPSEDLDRGYIEVVNRRGVTEKISIMTISIIGVDYRLFSELSFDDAYKRIVEVKKKAKMIDGSVLLIDKDVD